MTRSWLWKGYLGASLAASVAYFLLPGGGLRQAGLYMGLNLVMVAVLAVAVARYRPAGPAAWRVLLASQVLYLTATFLWYPYPILAKAELAFPGPHDPLFMLSYLLEAAALAAMARLRSGGRNRADLIDAIIIALGLGVILWAFQIDRALEGSGLSLVAQAITVAYPLFDLVLFALVVRLAVGGGRRHASLWFIGAAVTCQLAGDIGYAETALRGSFHNGAPIFGLYLLSFVFLGTGALHPSMRDLCSPVTRRVGTTLRRRLPFMAAAALVGPAVVLVQYERGVRVDTPVLVGIASAVFLLVLARVSDLMVDVAEHERVQEELSRLALIVESTDDAVVGWSMDGTFTSWNGGATKLYGYRAEEAIGQPFTLVLPPHCRDEADDTLRRLVAGEEVGHLESERLRKDGTIVPVSITLSTIKDRHGTVVAGSTISRDISEAKRNERDLAVARDQALEASRLKSEFLATMSHEIRTPMNGVIGLTGLLLTTPLDERQRQYAEGVRGAGDALLSVINDILDFSKLEAGKVDIEVADFDVRQVVEDVAALMAESAQGKGLELAVFCHPGVPTAVCGDPGRLRQVLVNLAGNAVKFTERGDVVLKVTPTTETGAGVGLRFEVSDTGIGISPADSERLFDPFSQADSSTTRRYGGTGLGLAISNRLVAAMGGKLGLDSRLGHGSNFWFELSMPRGKLETASAPPAAGLLGGVPVLVVDDNATNRLILETQLRAWGMAPDSVEDGPSALRRLRQAAGRGTPYRLAVLDMCMPDMDGLDLARRIGNQPDLPFPGLMLLTSAAGVEVSEARRAGVAAVLTKPVRQSQLLDALVGVLAPRPAAPIPVDAGAATPELLGHVLVVEDNLTNQMVALGILAHIGWTADVAANGLEAVEAVREDRYDAVLMDCEMPEMDGYTATGEIRRREGDDRHTPIIAMTANAVEGDRERCLAAGMDDYVAKPVTPEAVGAALARCAGPVQPVTDELRGAGRNGPGQAVDRARIDVLRAMGPSDGSLFGRMVDAFLDDAASSLASLRAAVEGDDTGAVRAIAHRVRGSAANLGATRMAEVCARLEVAAAADDLSAAAGLLGLAEDELAPVSDALRGARAGTWA